ncbi:unannotated protein [freshwater metagenome]|uniref:Unannotated protein n=1 Tax=freshwater metagenome TaxID=449393 RepID=A0A6J7KFX2_9ZZZZ
MQYLLAACRAIGPTEPGSGTTTTRNGPGSRPGQNLLSINDQAGVENVLDVLRGGIDACLLGRGKSHVNELTPDDVTAPDGFFRTLGA